MTTTDLDIARHLLVDGFSRIADGVPVVLDGLTPEQLLWRPDPEANHVAWLVWHLTRQQDAQIAALSDHEPAWTGQGFVDRFALPYDTDEHGYGMSSDEVGAFPATDPALFAEHQRAVFELTRGFLEGLTAHDVDRVVDEDWDPPVTLGARVVSVMNDAAKHLGQAEYLRGLVLRRP